MPAAWFACLDALHHSPGRVRFRYRCYLGTPHEPQRISRTIEKLSGVRQVRVNPRAHSLIVHFEPDLIDADGLGLAILALPPPPEPLTPLVAAPNSRRGLAGVAVNSAALLLIHHLPERLKVPVATVTSLPLLLKALQDGIHRGITSHVLEALAVLISIQRRDFRTANTTLLLLALGEYLEHTIARRSDDLLKHLLRPAHTEVWVERDGAEVKVDAGDVCSGDTVIAATGTVIPVDGVVLGGEALVNEATMTGEGLPVTRRRRDRVLSGTLVQEGRLRIYAEQVGSEAAVSRIADFVEQSLSVKSATQLQTSRLADQLVPWVLGLAGGTWALTRDWNRVAAVLQADYSCALKLATPVAFKAAMYQAGRSGMLVKGASVLERLAEADTVVFDKTGTLSSGDLEVTDAITFDAAYSSQDLINLAASVEEHYFHPLAMAVVEAAQRLDHPHHFDHKEVEFIVAHGVASIIDGKRIVVGSRHFIEDDEGITVAPHNPALEALRAEGKALLYIGFGGELLGVLALQDSLRHNSAATVARLRQLGVQRVLMLTGDQTERARQMAEELGLDAFHAELLPEEKAQVMESLAAEGAKIAFVGDGVNDAPALSGAQVGIAMHTGADIARLAADITLLEDNIARVADARALALATQGLIQGNFYLTLGLNTSILSAAALGGLSPVSASMLHNGSTIAILLRALAGAGLRPWRWNLNDETV